jgi:DNA polymerase gamma 1
MSHFSPLGYSVLSPEMTGTTFGAKAVEEYEMGHYTRVLNDTDFQYVNDIMEEMEKFGVEFPIKNPDSFTSLPEFYIPPLRGDNIAEHFDNIGSEILSGKVRLLKSFANCEVPEPPQPSDLVYVPGWTRYRWDPEKPWIWTVESVGETGLEGIPIAVFDCETFVKGSDFGHPILATAVSPDSYWVWMHESFVDETIPHTPTLVPLGTVNSLLIAHNVGFDRQRTQEAYYVRHDPFHPTEPFGNLWFDTMSAHINVSGLASEQRFMFTQNDSSFAGVTRPIWADKGSMNNLVDAYNFHCQPVIPMEKESKKTRNLFVVAESMVDFVPDRDELVSYALRDVKVTYDLYAVLVLKYLQANPSLTTLYGHFAQTGSVLPVISDWNHWVANCEKVWEESISRQDELLGEMAEQLLLDWRNDDVDVVSDPWLSQLDWEANYALKKDGKPKSVWYGIPIWYRKNAKNSKELGRIVLEPITTKSRVSHILLRLKWKGQPLVYNDTRGWTYWDDEKSQYERVPHTDGDGINVGGVLSKDYLDDFESGTLSSDLPQAQELIRLAIKVSYWTSVRSRVRDQLPTPAIDSAEMTIVIPQTVPHNTATNRAGERLWLTVPDPKPDKIGTEVKTRVQVESPWTFVSSDYDGQESVVASIFADCQYRMAGSTQFGHSVLAGSKEDGTDMHSVTASTIGISRTIAKNCNYGMLYGSGAKTLAATIRKGNKSILLADAMSMGKKLIASKKGKKASAMSPNLVGGSDSFAYNEMSRIANTSIPLNPLSGTRMSTSFRPEVVGSDFFTMRNNWVIQSTGSAMLHAFLTAMEHLTRRYGVQARFCMSVHDSVLFMCLEEDADLVSALYQVAHLWSWAWLRYNYGICEMPHANAWFSSIEVDKIFRKAATAGTVTVSQPVREPDGRAHTITTLVPVLNSLRTLERTK